MSNTGSFAIDQKNNEAHIESLRHRFHIAKVSIKTDEAVMDGMEALIALLTTRNIELEEKLREVKK